MIVIITDDVEGSIVPIDVVLPPYLPLYRLLETSWVLPNQSIMQSARFLTNQQNLQFYKTQGSEGRA